LHNAVIKKLV